MVQSRRVDRGPCPTERPEVTAEGLMSEAARTEQRDVMFGAPGDVLARSSAYVSRVRPLSRRGTRSARASSGVNNAVVLRPRPSSMSNLHVGTSRSAGTRQPGLVTPSPAHKEAIDGTAIAEQKRSLGILCARRCLTSEQRPTENVGGEVHADPHQRLPAALHRLGAKGT